MTESTRLQELVAEVAAAYFSNSHVSPTEIPTVVQQIASSLAKVRSSSDASAAEAAGEESAAGTPKRMHGAQVKKSISPQALISFEDGKPYKMLKRHLAKRGLTPQQYREKWGLPTDYPMVSPNYSALRSQAAKRVGLGQLRRSPLAATPAKTPAGRARRKAAAE